MKYLQSRDLMSWSSDLRSSMKAQEKVRDAPGAQALKTEHERMKAEIEAREDVFSKVVENGRGMIDENHYAVAEVKDRVNKVFNYLILLFNFIYRVILCVMLQNYLFISIYAILILLKIKEIDNLTLLKMHKFY